MRGKADSITGRRSSTLFGEAPSFDELRKKDRYRIDSAYRVTMVGFWYWFRVSLPLTAPVLLVLFFLIPYIWFNATDGYIFFGGVLSIGFSMLAIISYFHIPPWRRHPSSLMIQICLMSVVISSICIYNAYPSGKISDLKDASDINISGYDDKHDHLPSCVIMSFFIQLTLLAREMWILTLSLDLLTSITNPFASYTQNIRKYHTFIWVIALISASVLVFDGRCQGEFLNNGTCWLKVSGIHSVCFWGYFMSWIILFYINAMTVLTYAYTRITKGLESTFATRFAFVADTFRVVFFYFFYGFFLALIFIMLYYYDDDHPKSALTLEHILAFFISARGFFDALVWFFSHGFVTNRGENRGSDVGQDISGVENDSSEENHEETRREYSIYASTLRNRRLFMKDIVTLSMFWSTVAESFRRVCGCKKRRQSSNHSDTVINEGNGEDGDNDENEDDCEVGASAEEILANGKGRRRKRRGLEESETALLADIAEEDEDDIIEDSEEEDLDLLLDTQRVNSNGTSGAVRPAKSKQSHRQISFKLDNDLQGGDSGSESNSQNIALSQSQSRGTTASSLRLTSSGQRKKRASHSTSNGKKARASVAGRSSDLDVSPQLNLALREEVLSLVTQGIKESVKRMMFRDQQQQQYTPGEGVYAQSIYHPSSPPGRDRFDMSQSMNSQMSNEEFERIRLSDASERASPNASGKNGPPVKAGTVPQSQSATKYRSIMDFLSYSFYPTNPQPPTVVQTPAPPTTQDSRSQRTLSNALHGLLSAVGAYIPGEYGVDPIHSHLEQHSMGFYSSSYSSSQQNLPYVPGPGGHLTASYHFNASMSHSLRPSVASSIYDERGLPIRQPPVGGTYFAPGGINNPMRNKAWGPPGTNTAIGSGQEDVSSRSISPVPGATGTTAANNQPPAVVDPSRHNSYALGRSYQSQYSQYYSPSKQVPTTSQHYLLDTLAQVASGPTTTTGAPVGANNATPGGTVPTIKRKPPPAEVIFLLNGTHAFRDFRPSTFQKLRQIGEIDENHYLECISQPTHEKLSEGKSGAFFFLCGDGEIVVKTVEKEEAMTLLSILDQYVTHLINNPHSLLVRFLGLHSIKMYGNEFYFVVMRNIFPQQDPKSGERIHLNEKYDIKGSWIQRNASMPDPGKFCTCRHCGEDFIEGGPMGSNSGSSLLGSTDMCTEVVGGHEAMVTLKDNDLIAKIRLYPEDAFQIIDTLYSDSDALCAMGVMDYSLLVGVRHARYDVDTLHRMQQFAPQSLYPSSTSDSNSTTNSPLMIPTTDANNNFNPRAMTAGYPARVVIAPKEYYFGVIDVLQTWSWSKKLERMFKVYILGQASEGISCMNPQEFKERYQRKIGRIIEHANIVREVTGSWQGKRDVGAAAPLVAHHH